jgi:dihydroflavonol-4-reductase
MTKALVLGATGHIGNAMMRELLHRNYKVTGVGRRSKRSANLIGLPIDYVVGDHDWPGQIERWVPEHDIVVDAAGAIPLAICEGLGAEDELSKARRRTDELIDTCFHHGASLCYVSSPSTFKRWSGRLDEWPAHLIRQLHPYFRVKDVIEEQILDAAASGLRAVIINPTWCFGPWDSRDRSLCLIPRLLTGEIPATLNHILNIVDVRDVAAATVTAVETERHGTPILLSGHNISANILFSWICEIGGAKAPSLTVPPSIAALGSIWIELAAHILGRDRSFRSFGPIMLSQHEFVPVSGGLAELGVRLRPLYETLLDALAWYKRIGHC